MTDKISKLKLIKREPDSEYEQLVGASKGKPFVLLWLTKDDEGHDMPNIGYDSTDQEAAFLLGWGMQSLMRGYEDGE